jgi:hypothetical protein
MDALTAILKMPLVQVLAGLCVLGGGGVELLAIRTLAAAKLQPGQKPARLRRSMRAALS